MTNAEKRIKIAEACGWQFFGAYGEGVQECHNPDGKVLYRASFIEECLPDYFSDLNACHEMEKILLTGDGWRQRLEKYSGRLMKVMHETDFGRIDVAFHGDMVGLRYFTCHATASQRAEAFGKTMNLW